MSMDSKTRRALVCMTLWAVVLLMGLLVALPGVSAVVDVPRSPVWDIVPTWTAPPVIDQQQSSVPDGPLMGNGGALGVVVGSSSWGDQLTFFLSKNDFWTAPISGVTHSGYGDGGVRQVGGVSVEVPALLEGPLQFKAQQWMGNASVWTSQKGGPPATDLEVQSRSFVARDTNLMVTALTFTAPAEFMTAVEVNVRVWLPAGGSLPTSIGYVLADGTNVRSKGKTQERLSGKLAAEVESVYVTRTNGNRYQLLPKSKAPQPFLNTAAIATRLMWDNGTTLTPSSVIVNSASVLLAINPPTNGQVLYLLTYVASNADAMGQDIDPLSQATLALHLQTPLTIAGTLASTQDHWLNYWNASSILWPDDSLTMGYWYGSQYILGLISKKGAVAPGLFGSFITSDAMPFGGDYTLNYNFQSPYYAVASSNRLDVMAPYFDAVIDFMAKGQQMADEYFGCPGVHYTGHIGPWGMISSDVGDMGQRSDAVFAAVIFAHRFMYSLDLVWLNTEVGMLQKTPYEFMTSVADFWLCYLQKNVTSSGYTYNSMNDCAYELCGSTADGQAYDVNPTTTLSFLRYHFSTLVTIERQMALSYASAGSSDKAGEAIKRALVYADVVDNLAPFATGLAPDGSGAKVFQASYLVAPLPPGGNPIVTSVLWPAGGTIGLGSDPETLKTAQNTIQSTDSWWQGNAFPQIYPAAVRAGYNVSTLLANWRTTLGKWCKTNLYCSVSDSGIEGLGALGTVNEMLMQSHEGFIRLFPMVPLGGRYHFTSLRATNATLVSAWVDEIGYVHDLVVTSEQGAPIKLYQPWPLSKAIGVCYYGTQDCEQLACPFRQCSFDNPQKGQTYSIRQFP